MANQYRSLLLFLLVLSLGLVLVLNGCTSSNQTPAPPPQPQAPPPQVQPAPAPAPQPGVLSLPEKCTFPVSLACIDFSVAANSITLILQNGAGRDMIIKSVTAASTALGTGTGLEECGTASSAVNLTLRNGASASFRLGTPVGGGSSCNFKDTGRDKNTYKITLTYIWVDSPPITHVLTGELLARKP